MAAQAPQISFVALELHSWRQFNRVHVDFHPRLTVLTGANAAGKTTILSILAQHFGWGMQFVSALARSQKGRELLYLSGWWGRASGQPTPDQVQIGSLSYSNGLTAPALVPESGGSPAFTVNVQPMQAVAGLYLPSHRPTVMYQPVTQIPTTLPSQDQMLEAYLGDFRNRYLGSGGNAPSFRLKESLISLATFGYGNEAVEANPEAVELFEGFQDALRRVLPPSLGFDRLTVRIPEVVLETSSGNFPFDAMSGGLASIIDLTWQIYMRSRSLPAFAVLIDEPENHLHPQLQRALLPGFLEAFPTVQFVVATHNPFVVSSVPDSNVYVLQYNEDQRVDSMLLDPINKAGTSNEILRDVLGLEFTLPLWVESRLAAIIDRYEHGALDQDALERLRGEMEEMGLDHLFPEAVSQVLDPHSDD